MFSKRKAILFNFYDNWSAQTIQLAYHERKISSYYLDIMRRERIIVKFIVLLTLLQQCTLATPMPQEQHENGEERSSDGDYRLPTAVTPENYKLEITTNLNDSDSDGFTFSGVVEIIVSENSWIKIYEKFLDWFKIIPRDDNFWNLLDWFYYFKKLILF